MPYSRLSTAKIARVVGCHPNTVRLYEAWGFLPPVERSRTGYRLYTIEHLDQMRLARLALNTSYAGPNVRHSAVALVRYAAGGDLGGALELAYRHLALVQAELAQAEAAASLLERWAQGAPTDATSKPLRIGEAAKLLGLTPDMLRNWETDGLLCSQRNPCNRYRLYGQVEIARLRVIRMLRLAGYSTISILRMLTRLDRGDGGDLRQALNAPDPDDDIINASDRWLSTLQEHIEISQQMINLIEERIQHQQV